MKLYANDTVQITSVKAEPLLEGEAFEVDDEAEAELFIKRGLASKEKPGAKAEPPLRNKADPDLKNKTA